MIRNARITDAAGIQQLNKTAMGYDFPVAETEKKLQSALADPGQCVLVAVENGQIVGYVHMEDYDTLYFPHMKNVLALAVEPGFRRRGIGSQLLAAGETWAKETGAAGIRLVSGIQRVGAHVCYRRNGYQELKLQKNFKKLF